MFLGKVDSQISPFEIIERRVNRLLISGTSYYKCDTFVTVYLHAYEQREVPQ